MGVLIAYTTWTTRLKSRGVKHFHCGNYHPDGPQHSVTDSVCGFRIGGGYTPEHKNTSPTLAADCLPVGTWSYSVTMGEAVLEETSSSGLESVH